MAVTRDVYLDALEREGRRMLACATAGDLAAPVPSCPGWTLGDLLAHTGRVHRMAIGLLQRSDPAVRATAPVAPAGDQPLRDWFAAGLSELLDELRRRPSSDRVVTRVPSRQSRRFWYRRMAHETLVHRLDAELAIGDAGPVDPVLAADGVAEMLEVFLVGTDDVPGRAASGAPGRSVRVRAVDAERAWTVMVRDGRWVWADDAEPPAAEVAGPAAALLRVVWRRGRLPDVPATLPDGVPAVSGVRVRGVPPVAELIDDAGGAAGIRSSADQRDVTAVHRLLAPAAGAAGITAAERVDVWIARVGDVLDRARTTVAVDRVAAPAWRAARAGLTDAREAARWTAVADELPDGHLAHFLVAAGGAAGACMLVVHTPQDWAGLLALHAGPGATGADGTLLATAAGAAQEHGVERLYLLVGHDDAAARELAIRQGFRRLYSYRDGEIAG